MTQLGAQEDESQACCKEPMPVGDQVKCMKHRSKPTGEVPGLDIWHFGGEIREGLLRELSSVLGHKRAGNQRASSVDGKARKLTSLAGAEGRKQTMGRKVQT